MSAVSRRPPSARYVARSALSFISSHSALPVRERARLAILLRARQAAGVTQAAPVPDADDVTAEITVGVAAGLRRVGGAYRRRTLRGEELDRHSEADHPDVGAFLEPVVVADEPEAA